MSSPEPGEAAHSAQPATPATVEELVRGQLSKALGGRRGMLEAAVPTIAFTVLYLSTRELNVALIISLASAIVLLVVRLVQRSTVQFVMNALFGIGIGFLFVYLAAQRGGDESQQALAYFLPGILYNAGYAVLFGFTCVIGWPLVGFMLGSVTGDATAWHEDSQVVKLCTRLTWILVIPCVLRAVIQGPIWFSGNADVIDIDVAIGILGVLKIVLGWPLQLAALGSMVWLLGRNSTPVSVPAAS